MRKRVKKLLHNDEKCVTIKELKKIIKREEYIC